MIKLKDNRVIITLTGKEINKLLLGGVIFQSGENKFRFLDNTDNIFIELKEVLKNG